MPEYTDCQLSPHTPRQLFDLVADVVKYPEFLPWCRTARILSRQEDEFLAELVISFKGMTERYTSRVVMNPPDEGEACKIDVTLVQGPFRHLVNHWRFSPAPGGGTRIDFFLDFQFRSRLLEKLIGGFFGRAAEHMVEAFEHRAEALYGERTDAG